MGPGVEGGTCGVEDGLDEAGGAVVSDTGRGGEELRQPRHHLLRGAEGVGGS